MVKKKRTAAAVVVTIIIFSALSYIVALPPEGYNKVAYYTFDATPVGQDYKSLINFTDNANIVVVFEGTLWELADTAHYDTQWMRNRIYTSKKHICDDIKTLQERGLVVLMNVDDAASWSTEVPFTTWDGKKLDYREFAAFIDSCVTVVGFDGISLDVEHNAVDNTHYRNLITEFGKYFGPLSSDSLGKMYIAAIYNSRYGVPGEIFREEALSRYLNFVMDMGYHHNNDTRFNFWADPLGSSKVMLGMSHEDNTIESAVDWISRHPAPETPGIMVYAGNVNKTYTDSIFSALGQPAVTTRLVQIRKTTDKFRIRHYSGNIEFYFSIQSEADVTIKIMSLTGRLFRKTIRQHYPTGEHCIGWNKFNGGQSDIAPGCYYVVLSVNNTQLTAPLLIF